MSKYKRSQQRSFDDIEVGLSGLPYEPKGFSKHFREVCDRIIPDTVFDDLYSDRGRPARSPSLLTRLLLLQLKDSRSDEQIVEDLYCDMRVRYMCDFGLGNNPIHPTNLVYHRMRLLYGTICRNAIAKINENGFAEQESPTQDIFDRVRQAAVELGLIDNESGQLIDSTAIFGRAAVMDGYGLIFHGIRDTLRQYSASVEEDTGKLIARLSRQDYLEDVTKPKIDWESDEARAQLLADLVSDAVQILEAGLSFEDKELEKLLKQLKGLVAQEVETSDNGRPKLKEEVDGKRQISVVDPDMRHGRKSKSKKFDGYKGTITADPKSGVITAVHVMGGNEPDSVAVAPIIEQQACKGNVPPVLIGDRAYAAEDARYEAMKLGVAVVTKPSVPISDKEFGKSSFAIDMMSKKIVCPSGQERSIVGKSVHFGGKRCEDCPYRVACLTKSGRRVIKIRKHEAQQRDADAFAKTDRGKEMLSLRPAIERVIAYWVRNGVRQARYFGRPKVWLQAMLSAILCNLGKIAKYGVNGSDILRKIGLYDAYTALTRVLKTIVFATKAIIEAEFVFARKWTDGRLIALRDS
jgi:hypothetical protein